MLAGFEKIVEQRIKRAQQNGEFENLQGKGKPLRLDDFSSVHEDLRLAYKILKNADCLPPALELKKEIKRTEELLADMDDTAEKYHTIKKLNFLIMKLNTVRGSSIQFEMPQQYSDKLLEQLDRSSQDL